MALSLGLELELLTWGAGWLAGSDNCGLSRCCLSHVCTSHRAVPSQCPPGCRGGGGCWVGGEVGFLSSLVLSNATSHLPFQGPHGVREGKA